MSEILEDRGLSALVVRPTGVVDKYAEIAERALVFSAAASLGAEVTLKAYDVDVAGRLMGRTLAALLTMRLVYAAADKPSQDLVTTGAESSGIDKIKVSLSLGEVVLLPAMGGMTLLMSPGHQREGAALLGMSAVGAGISALVLAAK